jgi:hypothetical protein
MRALGLVTLGIAGGFLVSPAAGQAQAVVTGIPRDYAECVQIGGVVLMQVDGTHQCQVSFEQYKTPELYEECRRVGGGRLTVCSPEGGAEFCRLRFLESGGTCHSNFCD